MSQFRFLYRIALPQAKTLVRDDLWLPRDPLLSLYVPARSFKTELKIQWVRPEKKLPFYAPQSGDLVPMESINKEKYMLEFEDCEELKDADKNVKKIFSLGFQYPIRSYFVYKKELADKVRRHALDGNSHEVRIANMTARVRYLQDYMAANPHNIKRKVELKELVDQRKKQLKHLRRWDYKRFEWILEKLDLEYRPSPSCFNNPTRRGSLTILTAIHCETIKEKRLAEYKRELNERKVPFLEDKIAKLKWVQEEEKKWELPPTVQDSDIAECVKMLEEVKQQLKSLEGVELVRTIDPHTLELI